MKGMAGKGRTEGRRRLGDDDCALFEKDHIYMLSEINALLGIIEEAETELCSLKSLENP